MSQDFLQTLETSSRIQNCRIIQYLDKSKSMMKTHSENVVLKKYNYQISSYYFKINFEVSIPIEYLAEWRYQLSRDKLICCMCTIKGSNRV
jgi:hypothetical protein